MKRLLVRAPVSTDKEGVNSVGRQERVISITYYRSNLSLHNFPIKF
ncbi:MAG: hypothetical protein GX857_05055 [Bacteroidales bacterium]|nr:hypothetical protein [Bacteroidales bacterium]